MRINDMGQYKGLISHVNRVMRPQKKDLDDLKRFCKQADVDMFEPLLTKLSIMRKPTEIQGDSGINID